MRLLEALICFAGAGAAAAVALALVAEGIAVGFGFRPTISALVAGETLTHFRLSILGVLLFGVLAGALITHFTSWRP